MHWFLTFCLGVLCIGGAYILGTFATCEWIRMRLIISGSKQYVAAFQKYYADLSYKTDKSNSSLDENKTIM